MLDQRKAMSRQDHPNEPHASAEQVTTRGLRRWLFSGLAGVFLVLGALGAILPGLPTTPFLLLASYFLSRTSPRCNRVLLNSRFFGPILSDWQKHRGVRPDVKAQAVVIVALCVGLSIWISGADWSISAGVVSLAVIGITVIVRLPAVKTQITHEDEPDSEDQASVRRS